MAWTPVTQPSSTWTPDAQDAAKRVFDPIAFDTGSFNGLLIFDVGSPAGIWTADAAPASSWTPE